MLVKWPYCAEFNSTWRYTLGTFCRYLSFLKFWISIFAKVSDLNSSSTTVSFKLFKVTLRKFNKHKQTSQAVSCLSTEHRDDSGPGSVSLLAAVLHDVLDLIQIPAFITENTEVFPLRCLSSLLLFTAVLSLHVLCVYFWSGGHFVDVFGANQRRSAPLSRLKFPGWFGHEDREGGAMSSQ